MKSYKSLLTLVIAAASFGSAKADQLIVDFTGNPINFTNGAWTLGFEFQVNSPVVVTGLAVYDQNQGGPLAETQEAGLWNDVGTLLTSTTINAGTVATLGNGFFAAAPVAPLVLGTGDYIVGATSGSQNYTYDTTGFGSIPQITYLTDEYISGGSLQEPTTSEGIGAGDGGAWFGGNVVVGAASAPDTCSTWLLATIALATLAALRRRVAALV